MAYASASDVIILVRSLVAGASDFGAETSPMSFAVGSWLSSGCAIIEAKLGALGYDAPGSTAAGYGMLRDLNALFAAGRAELSRVTATVQPGERTRGQVFDKMFWEELNRLDGMDLSMAGFARSSTGKLYVGGISQDDKDTWNADSDRVSPRIKRGMFSFPGTVRPDSVTSAS